MGESSTPQDVAIDSSMNLFVATDGYDAVFRRSQTGAWTLNIPTGQATGVVLDAAGTVYIVAFSSPTGSQVLKATPPPIGTSTTTATASVVYSGLNNADNIAFDGALLYITNTDDNEITVITTDGLYVNTLAGTTATPLPAPHGVTLDSFGSLYATTLTRTPQGATSGTVVKFVNVFTPASVPSSSSSSAAPAFASSSSSTANGAAYSDPYFHGFWNQPYYVHGRAGDVYSILSDPYLQLNSRFVFLSNVTCPVLAVNETARSALLVACGHLLWRARPGYR